MSAMSAPADQKERDAIRNDLGVTMFVEAAAGTGKTTSLVARMVNLVRREVCMPANLAAITFTVKAAAQLRERFQEGLEEAIRGAGEDAERQRLRDALEGIDRGFIGTTHAFCARLLRERPVEAGLDPEFEELDEGEARRRTLEFWNRWYEAQSLIGNPLIEDARQLELDRRILRNGFERVVEYPDITMVSSRIARPDLRAACEALSSILDDCVPHLPNESHREQPDQFEKLIVAVMRRRAVTDLSEPAGQLALLEEANHASRKAVQKRWPNAATAKQLTLRYSSFVTGTLRPLLKAWSEHVHGVAIELLTSAARAFESERRHEGRLTYQDLLLCARNLLRDHPTVRSYFHRRFTHILVDEFQDTDPLQAEILFYLTGDSAEGSWRNLTPRPGSLFIVGDPKQSIYRFRRADITTYLDVRKRIESAGGRIVQLSTNFRSTPAICAFVNETFRPMFDGADVEAGRQAQHVDLTPFTNVSPLPAAASSRWGEGQGEERSREELRPLTPALSPRRGEGERLVSRGVFSLETPRATNDAMAEAEARCVAEWIRRAVDSGMRVRDEEEERELRWSDVLLISTQRPRLATYAAALENAGVPYEITGSRAFQNASALQVAMPLLRAVVDPDDVVSLVAFLRGSLCGSDDDALARFVRERGAFSPFREVPAGADVRIARGLEIVRESIRDAEQHPPAATLGRLFDRIGLTALAASDERGGTTSGNLLLALAIAREESAKGQSLAMIVEHFDALLDQPPDVGELDVDPARTDAVRLMNLHQVKGLEAPVVFLIDPAEPYEFPVDLYVDRSGEESRGYLAVTRRGMYGPIEIGLPASWAAMQQTERAFKDAERRRLLYVAATRAKDLLVIGFTRTAKGVEGAWRELASRVTDRLFELGETTRPGTPVPAASLEFREAMDGIAAQFEDARRDSYSVLPVTKIAHESHAALVRAEEGLGKGTSWGRVLHRLFEAMLRVESLDVRLYAGNLLKDEERDAVELDEVLRVVEAVQSSSLWKRVKAADERYVEIPFALNVPRREAGLEKDGETLLHGTIDLVFREGAEWFLVDYKSDSTPGRIDALVAYYSPQVELYARFWSRLTGSPARAGLFFVDGCIEKWV